MSTDLTSLKQWFENHREAILDELFQFLAFKSVGTDPAFDQETKACGLWLVDFLQEMGFSTQFWETSGKPVVFAQHTKAGKDRPTLLFYHHYDVQPVDPENWESDPFTPTIRNGNIYARGAQDNKGQCFYTLVALKAFMELSKSPNINIKVFIEGEEESGSKGTEEVFATKREELKSDYLFAVDVGIPAPNTPAITLGLRGIVTMEVLLRVANIDMHSGILGGIAYNPLRALCKMLSSIWDDSGKILIEGFYDEVKDLSKEEKKELFLEKDPKQLEKEFGLKAFCPEPGFTIGETATIRPVIDINGLHGGYIGEGFKTVLPATAHAKISCRLVANQDPEKITELIKTHLEKHVPKGMEFIFESEQGGAPFRSSQDTKVAKVAAKAYEEVLEKPCKKILFGGSIPVVTDLVRAADAEAIVMGYALDSDQIHAPNEHFGLDRFEQGFLTIGRILSHFNEES